MVFCAGPYNPYAYPDVPCQLPRKLVPDLPRLELEVRFVADIGLIDGIDALKGLLTDL